MAKIACFTTTKNDRKGLGMRNYLWNLQERFIVRDKRKHPGRAFQEEPLFQIKFPFYNLPGFTDNVKVSLYLRVPILPEDLQLLLPSFTVH